VKHSKICFLLKNIGVSPFMLPTLCFLNVVFLIAGRCFRNYSHSGSSVRSCLPINFKRQRTKGRRASMSDSRRTRRVESYWYRWKCSA